MALRTVIYLRRSSDTEDKQQHSIDRQKREIKGFLEKHNHIASAKEKLKCNLEEDLYWEDASAKKRGRVEFNKMLRKIEKKKYDVLLCVELTRLSRNAVDTGSIVQLLEEKYLQQVRTLDKVFTTTPTDKFTLALFLSVSKYENDQRAVNTSSGMQNQTSKGHTTGKAPMGYLNKGEKKGGKSVDTDPTCWKELRAIWDMVLAGNKVKDAYREAIKKGLTITKKDGIRKAPGEETVRGMLRNRYYAGEVSGKDENGQKIWYAGLHEAMVTEEEFSKAQIMLQKHGYKSSEVIKEINLGRIISEIAVSGIYTYKGKPTKISYEEKIRYHCSHCKHRYYSAIPKPCSKCSTEVNEKTRLEPTERFAHLFYKDNKTNRPNKKDSVKADVVIKRIKQELSTLHITEPIFQVLRRGLYTEWLKEKKAYQKNRKQFIDQIEKLEEERLNLTEKQYQESQESKQNDLALLIERKAEQIEELEEKRDELKERIEETFEKAWETLQVLRDAKDILTPTGDFEPKKRILISLASNLKIHKDRVEIEWKKPFDKLAQSSVSNLMAYQKNGVKHHLNEFGSRGRI